MKHYFYQKRFPTWKWPIDITCYDCGPELYEYEKVGLQMLKQYNILKNMTKQSSVRTVLERFIKPINDVLNVTGAKPRARTITIRLLLLEIERRGRSFWGWSNIQWVKTICKESDLFIMRHNHASPDARQQVMAVAYLLCGFKELTKIGNYFKYDFAVRVFGKDVMEASLRRIKEALQGLGYIGNTIQANWPGSLSEALLINKSPFIDELTYEVLQQVRENSPSPHAARGSVAISRALYSLGIINKILPSASMGAERYIHIATGDKIAEEWVKWCNRWRENSPSSERTRKGVYTILIHTGRWLADKHPEINSPKQWTRELSAEFVAAIDQMKVGDYMHPSSHQIPEKKKGKPLKANSKVAHITAVRVFFRDCQEWGWLPRSFDPIRSFPIPRKVLAQRKPDPRVIADDIWAKLLWAGLNLTLEDLPMCIYRAGQTNLLKKDPWYPLTMVRAVTIVWLFAGLRSDEIRRLRIGCVRWQHRNEMKEGASELASKDTVCLLDIPVNKTGAAFTKPVDRYVGEAIADWERERPVQPPGLDPKTGSMEYFLFSYRGKLIGTPYINNTIIPMLCHKAGIPPADARGNITSHRARSTIASQLYNAEEPLSLFELQEWLGHSSLASTQHYAKLTQAKLSKSYRDAGYFERNMRTIEVLINREAVMSGIAACGEPWKFYDLGHGYCTYDFFDQCPHRMACAKCSFYLPKGSSKADLLEAKSNLLRMKQEIPLTNEELAAVEDGLIAIEKLCEKLADVATPDGFTPRQLHQLGINKKE